MGHELFLGGARSARSSSTVDRQLVLDMVVICFDLFLFLLRINCADSTGKHAMLARMVALARLCAVAGLNGPQQHARHARVPRHRVVSGNAGAFELLSMSSRSSSRATEGRTDGHVISFHFVSFIRHHPQTHERSFEGCQPASSASSLIITSCAGFCSGSRVSERKVRAHKPIHCPPVLALGYIHCAHLQLRSKIFWQNIIS